MRPLSGCGAGSHRCLSSTSTSGPPSVACPPTWSRGTANFWPLMSHRASRTLGSSFTEQVRGERAMGRTTWGTYTNSWTAPDYEVDENGKVVGLECKHEPNNWGRWGEFD